MTETTDRPLVTFALFAYNQEQYIREAVEGAFSQTYEPLEIILSDDCSSDRTFQIMQEMAAAYDGPHEIRTVRNNINLGLIEHINNIAEISNGEIILFAAGDDISARYRAERTTRAFEFSKDCTAVFCGVSEEQKYTSRTTEPINIQEIHSTEIFINTGGAGRGAAYAYRRDVLFWQGKIPYIVKSEDKFLPARACLVGKVYRLNEPLLYYRRHQISLTESYRRNASFAHQRPAHWNLLSEIIYTARMQRKIGLLEYICLQLCLNSAQLAKIIKYRNSANLIMLPARLIRRMCRKPAHIIQFCE